MLQLDQGSLWVCRGLQVISQNSYGCWNATSRDDSVIITGTIRLGTGDSTCLEVGLLLSDYLECATVAPHCLAPLMMGILAQHIFFPIVII